ncbi:MAG: hypothetical protein ACTH58_00300 [Marinomonas foliarum]|uniref:Uncharacterized protein n=1 Tax=Marinomonas foliarum TaxID=491950 RepID=A0A369AI47_9GAMM|nr:hypothetical protein [Marinomonas foliarum]RCX08841.1 hypothetical protein DFP77_101159 [Marinomonas foliarum]
MAGLDNGDTNLSLPIAQIESALHEYAYSPAQGITKLRQTLISVKNISKSLLSSPLYNQRLLDLLSAADGLLAQDAPYKKEYHLAFLSATDAIVQVIIGRQVDEERGTQLEVLLSAERACWQVVLSFVEQSFDGPSYTNFEARLGESTNSTISIDAYLETLSRMGSVSFKLDSVKNSVLTGCFSLVSVQSLIWLQDKFPELRWKALPKSHKKSEKELYELSFLPLFQNVSMSRDLRYRLLDRFNDLFKEKFYKRFSDYFSSDVPLLSSADRLVPLAEHLVPIDVDEGHHYLSIRHGGSVYIASFNGAEFFYLSCLGRDCLAYILYEVETSCGVFVFDREDCVGKFLVNEGDIRRAGERWFFSIDNNHEAEVLLEMPLLSKDDAFCLFPSSIDKVLVVQQGGHYFAIPYFFIRTVEAVSCQMPSPRLWSKNVWLNSLNELLIEPWLLNTERLPEISNWQESKIEDLPTKNGYYSGSVCGRMFWIEASLVSALLPYQTPRTIMSRVEEGYESAALLVHDGCCYDRVVNEMPLDYRLSFSTDDSVFTVILEWMGASIALPLSSCNWSAALPETEYIQDFIALDNMQNGQGEKSTFSYTDCSEILINKKNFVFFVAGVWPSLLLA